MKISVRSFALERAWRWLRRVREGYKRFLFYLLSLYTYGRFFFQPVACNKSRRLTCAHTHTSTIKHPEKGPVLQMSVRRPAQTSFIPCRDPQANLTALYVLCMCTHSSNITKYNMQKTTASRRGVVIYYASRSMRLNIKTTYTKPTHTHIRITMCIGKTSVHVYLVFYTVDVFVYTNKKKNYNMTVRNTIVHVVKMERNDN